MMNKLFSGGSREGAFFRRVDWTAFWTATVISLLVYFFTLGPSVTLEDSGELAVAGDHLGVPHPPGYPIWTMCAYVFARLFSWVTYQGQPTPAWSISLMSAVFAALAAGLTAMLITRSASDMMRDAHEGEEDFDEEQSNLLCWAGGVGGSLVFAFSPVMWSQATIVEVYTLNAFFLMWIFLLTYRWMRKPSDKILWLTAFVFGLGLTNYQVLLLAAVPLAVVIFLRDLALFRDFILVGIPVVLTAHVLQIGAMVPAQPGMAGPAYAKAVFAPSAYIVAGILAAAVAACCAVGARVSSHWKEKSAWPWLIGAGVALLALIFHVGSLKGAAMPYGYAGVPFSWLLPGAVLFLGLFVLFLLACTVPRGIFYALPVAAVQLAAFVMLRKGGMNGLTHPTTWWFWWGIVWNFAVIALAWLALPHGRTVALTTLFAELGVSFYIYMPIVSDLRNPPMNWGYPRTWEGFKHAITRGQYEKIAPADMFSPKFLKQLGTYCTDLRVQFTLIAATLGFIPFTLWSVKAGGRRVRAVYVASGLYLLTCVVVLLSEFMGGEPILRLDKLFIALILLLLLVGAVAITFRQIEEFALRTWRAHNISEGLTAGISLAGVAVVVGLFLAKGIISLMAGPGADPGTGTKAGAMALALVVMVAVGAGWYFFRKFAEEKADFRSDMDTVTQQWLISTAAAFLVMSVLLVALANIKGDLQDAFIQKVKFISSHGLFAIWIGYGLAFGLAIGNRLLKALVKRGSLPEGLLKPLRAGMVCAGLLIAAIPVYENYTNEYLVFSMSGAEQNGHDFGWQFGNYQLRGADAVTEELEADEEPLPNPLFPPEMEPNAYFFGGTDPGRFVPTYMIYSAQVRPDVFLVTQNALADNTYINTMRDLYGDQVWMPTPDDSAKAFQIYVDEVQAGKRPKNADLTIENGRVQVSGALGVMEINGILCDMIFQKNKARHAFYIEESYVINWMFPYLTPHGLIMKINAEKTPIDPATVRDDMLFWDWYTRHLLRSPMFRRDLPAQKSFSKLRSAIAGLYAARGMLAESERAFQEARSLYPVSPEANFRLIQEVLLRQARYAEAIDVLDEYNRRDPNNGRGFDFVGYIRRVRDTEARVRELTAKAQAEKTLAPEDAYELAMAYRDLGQNEAAASYLVQLASLPNLPVERLFEIGTLLGGLKKHGEAAKAMDGVMARLPPNLPAEHLLGIARVYGEAGQPDKMAVPLSRYLQLRPNDWQAWLDMATLYAVKQQQQQFQYALRKALDLGRGAALQRIQEHPLLRQAAGPILQQMMQQGPAGLPGLGPRGR
jgi:tetratricopeptide (TPR) repeat protein